LRLLKQSSTAQPLVFLMVDSGDHITGKTGLSPTVTLSKSGGSFASPSGAVTEIANGWYKCAGNATDTATLGPLILHATGSGADPVDVEFEVVAFDPQTTSMGLSLAKTTNITGFNDLSAAQVNAEADTALSDVGVTTTVTGRIDAAVTSRMATYTQPTGFLAATFPTTVASTTNITAGTITTTTNLTNLPTIPANWITAAGITAASLNGKGDWGTATTLSVVSDNVVTARDNTVQIISDVGGVASDVAGVAADVASVQTDTTAIKAKTDNLPASPAAVGSAMALTTGERGAVADAVWDEATSGHATAGTTGKALTDAASGGSAPTAAAVADAVWDESRSGHTTSGTFGKFLDAQVSTVSGGGGGGTGDTPVTSATLDVDGDDLLVKTSGGSGIDDVQIRFYVASEYDADPTGATARAEARTVADGTWGTVMLDSGVTYTFVPTKSGYTFETTQVEP
jgi:hypothetical protein